MKYSEIHKKLKANGCYLVKNGANHPHWFSPITGLIFQTSYHESEEAKTGTMKKICKLSGVKL